MKQMLEKIRKVSPLTLVNALALMVVAHNVSVACLWFAYQPEVPESAKKFIKE